MAKKKKEARRPRTGEERFAAYPEAIVAVLGHASRAAAARAYCTGLLLPGERKSVAPRGARPEPGRGRAERGVGGRRGRGGRGSGEPRAAGSEPGRVQGAHQSLHHVVAKAGWDDAAL